MIKQSCKFCGKTFETFNCRIKSGFGQFCSRACARKGNPSNPWLGKKNPHFSKIMKDKVPWNKGKDYPAISKEKHWNWQGGVTPIHLAIRSSAAYKEWRKSVYERDSYTCVECGYRGNKLIADHINSFSKYPNLRLEIQNGRTLCRECHKKTPNYCGRARTYA